MGIFDSLFINDDDFDGENGLEHTNVQPDFDNNYVEPYEPPPETDLDFNN